MVLGDYDSYPGRLHSKVAARKIKVADSLRQSARETLIVDKVVSRFRGFSISPRLWFVVDPRVGFLIENL